MIHIFFLYAILASSYMCSKSLMGCISPITLVTLTSLGAGLILFGAYLYNKRTLHIPNFSQFVKDMTLVACGTTVGATILRYYALSCVSTFFVTLVMVFDPFVTAGLSYLIQGIPCNLYQIGAICLAVAGTLPLLTSELSTAGTITVLPLVALIAALCINRLGWMQAQKVMDQNYSPTLVTAANLLIGGLISAAFAITNNYHHEILSLNSGTMCKILYVLVANNIINSWGYTYLLSKFPITLLAITEFLTPCFVALLGWLLWSQPVDWKLVVSLVSVCLGLTLFMKFQTKKQIVKETVAIN